jgi:hypothetical protein
MSPDDDAEQGDERRGVSMAMAAVARPRFVPPSA